MAELYGKVRIEYSKLSGSLIKSQLFKKHQRLQLDWDPQHKKLKLTIGEDAEAVRFNLSPPLQMTTAQIAEGRMGIALGNCKMTYTSEPMRVQIMLSESHAEKLQKLRDAINVCMSRILGRPLQQLPQKVESSKSRQDRLLKGKRKADALSGGPSMSDLSTGSRDSEGLDGVTSKPSTSEGEDLPELSEEQQRIMDVVMAGQSVFFTGCAGTGKSLVLKHILKTLPAASTFVTASTGIAASHLGGTTLHAFAGIGRATDLAGALPGAKSRDARQRWQKAKVLIVDEVSMVDAKLFDLVEEVARHVRNSDEPFGGIKIVLCGDFHQLPPVHNKEAEKAGPRKFCFESEAWRSCQLQCMQLTQVFRQADNEFVNMLSKIRSGQGGSLVKDLKERCSAPVDLNGIVATKLFTHREDVDAVNAGELRALAGDVQKFAAKDTGSEDILRISCPARRSLELKVGAQVMLIRNISQKRGLVNGARGVIERWVGRTNPLPVVRFVNGTVTTIGKEKWNISSGGKTIASRSQLPLELGWAVTVHKCQGMTLDAVQINLERAFEPGMAYVALSRVKSLEGLQIVGGIHSRALEAHPKVVAFYKALERFAGKMYNVIS